MVTELDFKRVAHLPVLGLESVLRIDSNKDKPVESGIIAPVRGDSSLIKFDPEELIFGIYRDRSIEGTDVRYLIHSKCMRPFGGTPVVTPLSEIIDYRKQRDF